MPGQDFFRKSFFSIRKCWSVKAKTLCWMYVLVLARMEFLVKTQRIREPRGMGSDSDAPQNSQEKLRSAYAWDVGDQVCSPWFRPKPWTSVSHIPGECRLKFPWLRCSTLLQLIFTYLYRLEPWYLTSQVSAPVSIKPKEQLFMYGRTAPTARQSTSQSNSVGPPLTWGVTAVQVLSLK